MNSLNLKPTLIQEIAGIFDIELIKDKESKQAVEQMRSRVGKIIGKNYLEEIIYQIGYGKTIFSDENMKNNAMPIFIKTHLDLTTSEEKETLRKIIEGLKSYKTHQYKLADYCRNKAGIKIDDNEEIDTVQLDYFLELLN